MCGLRSQLGFRRGHIRPKRCQRFAQVLDRSFIPCVRRTHQKQECKKEGESVHHIFWMLHLALRGCKGNRKSAAKCLSLRELTKIRSDIWFEIEVPQGDTTEGGGVNNC